MTQKRPEAPTLSVLIPVFNWRIGPLLASLAREVAAHQLQAVVDIHVFDDGSSPEFAQDLRTAVASQAIEGVRIGLDQPGCNAGRSAARNALLRHARGSHLLFLDADVLPDREDFLRSYLAEARAGHDVVCGGVSYQQVRDVAPAQAFYLRYSSEASVASPEVRNRCPWLWVFTANMMVARPLMDRIAFDTGFQGYGYEDIEWGLRLHQARGIVHVDNPVTHLGLLSKAVLQRKMQESAANLVHMQHLHPEVVETMGLVRAARRCQVLPAGVLSAMAGLAGWVFAHCAWPYRLEWTALQAEKVLRAALALRQQALGGK